MGGLVLAAIIAVAACGGSSIPGGPGGAAATLPQPTPTEPPWPAGWDSTVCFARKQAGDALTHFTAAGEALKAYDLDVANDELTDAANDAKEVGEYLSGTATWERGQAFFDALERAGVELRKAAGLSKLVLTNGATVKEATKQSKVAGRAYTDSESEYATLSAQTGLECVW